MQAANTLMDTELTDAQWPIADAIARQLVLDGVDVNVSAMVYLSFLNPATYTAPSSCCFLTETL